MTRGAAFLEESKRRRVDARITSRRNPTNANYRRQKRVLDVAVCLAILPVMLPVIVLCALLIKLTSKGPVLFVQERTGRGGRRFKMLKLRTMVPNAADMKDGLKAESQLDGPDFKLTDDPRVTRIGMLLRMSSLDEAPQLWNVLRGDMSLVGPRPTSFEPNTYDLWHTERLEVMPGLTGLWQLAKRGDIDFDHRVRLDIAYVRHRSLPLDLSILIRTIPAVLSRRGAY